MFLSVLRIGRSLLARLMKFEMCQERFRERTMNFVLELPISFWFILVEFYSSSMRAKKTPLDVESPCVIFNHIGDNIE